MTSSADHTDEPSPSRLSHDGHQHGATADAGAKATAIGCIAILLWSALALLTKAAGSIPPFQLLSYSFGIAFAASVVLLASRGPGAFRVWRQAPLVWLLGFAGIFTYHALYFYALQAAPPADASLIAYLWPLLIVLLSTAISGSVFRWQQLAGAAMGFGGTALIVLSGSRSHASDFAFGGYAAASGCALVWAFYSVANSRFKEVPSDLIGGICGLVAVAGFINHMLFETTTQPSVQQWLAIVGLGLGPVGAAFFAWDYATKHGRLPVLGTLSYAAPLISSLLLAAAGLATLTWSIMGAALLIVFGALIASTAGRSRSSVTTSDT